MPGRNDPRSFFTTTRTGSVRVSSASSGPTYETVPSNAESGAAASVTVAFAPAFTSDALDSGTSAMTQTVARSAQHEQDVPVGRHELPRRDLPADDRAADRCPHDVPGVEQPGRRQTGDRVRVHPEELQAVLRRLQRRFGGGGPALRGSVIRLPLLDVGERNALALVVELLAPLVRALEWPEGDGHGCRGGPFLEVVALGLAQRRALHGCQLVPRLDHVAQPRLDVHRPPGGGRPDLGRRLAVVGDAGGGDDRADQHMTAGLLNPDPVVGNRGRRELDLGRRCGRGVCGGYGLPLGLRVRVVVRVTSAPVASRYDGRQG